MPNDVRPIVEGFDNVDWMNAIRNDLGYDYQSRIPEVTQANIKETVANLWQQKSLLNQFVDALVNRIGLVIFADWSWSNPLAPLKRGMLEFGDTIEEIMVGLIDPDVYDANRDEMERELFGAKSPEVQASYHKVNRENRYKLTVRDVELRKAFTSSNGLTTFVTQLLSAAQKSDQLDEFTLMAGLFKVMDEAAGGFFNVQISDIGDEESTPEQSKYALRRMREFGHTLAFPSRNYNAARMPMAINPDDLILFTTPQAQAAIDVEALAGAFNIEKAEFAKRTFVLPAEYYGIPGFQNLLTTKEFFVVADYLMETTSLANPSSLLTNYWLHHHQVISASRFAPVIMFNSLRESTDLNRVEYEVTAISSFTITDEDGATQATNLKRGENYNVIVEGVTNPVGGPLGAVDLVVEGNTSTLTRITNGGVLKVGINETGQTLTIRAISVNDDGYPNAAVQATTTRTIVGDGAHYWPDPRPINDADNDGTEETVFNAPVEDPDNVVTVGDIDGGQWRKTIKEAVTFTASGNVVGAPKHGADAGDIVVFGTITTTTGVTAGTQYYVRSAGLTDDAFTFSATPGGAAVVLTGNGSAASARFNIEPNSVHTIAGQTDIDVVATSGFELPSGTTLWSFDN
jgi:hypothetical protein